ncbi:transient receptor potential cation channel subfamily M member 3-like isoform X1 [Lytechinus variegatus]|uniref:transient receptor potential cation channel subfamily M member 3-like isoform X1 n=1 Tax=Lytechinus variegatus TaxID=7654 RepID=UPI001BB0DAFE|nr:transient receptor potential cation channel subfamily M member 3-like isoform X1 [Lytechinus variegatus]
MESIKKIGTSPSNSGTSKSNRTFSLPNQEEHLSTRWYTRAQSLTDSSSPCSIGQVKCYPSRDETIFIKENFFMRECVKFCPSENDATKCKCGRLEEGHLDENIGIENGCESTWSPETHTKKSQTNSFGELEFQGPWTSTRAKYVRLSHDTPAEKVLSLLTEMWGLKKPKLLIEVTGGAKDFVLQPKLKRIFSKGIIRVAVSTDAWILTGGTNTGVMRHVGMAVREHSLRSRQKINAIGVVPWGIVDNREDLIEKRQDVTTPRIKHYRLTSSDRASGASLDPNHTHFILVDDGSVGKFGVEISLRSKLEKLISSKKIDANSDRPVPAVCVCLEGGVNTIKVVLENVTHDPPIPVVIADGSGRAADLIAYAYRNSSPKSGQISYEAQEQLKKRISAAFPREKNVHSSLLKQLLEVIKQKPLITIFSVESDNNIDIDSAILSALLKASNLSAPEQLKLSLIWNRVDFAKEHIFTDVSRWEESALEEAMEIALKKNRVKFVKLLLEHGLFMQKFLTKERLESLYNTLESDPFPSLSSLSRYANINSGMIRLRQIQKHESKVSLLEIGIIIEHLLGKGFESEYTRHSTHNTGVCVSLGEHTCCEGEPESAHLHHDNPFPYNDLFIWAILTKKHEMAYLMWQLGQESLAKALIGFRLNYSMSRFARSQYNTDAADQLTEQSRLYEQLAVTLLTQCFDEDASYTRLLLCTELSNWSHMTCLSLAANFKHSRFIAHPSIQLLLNDHWYGQLKTIPGLKEFFQWLLCTNDDVDDDVGQGEYMVTSRRNTQFGSSAETNMMNADSASMKVAYEPRPSVLRFPAVIEDRSVGVVNPQDKTGRRNTFQVDQEGRESYFQKVRIIFTAPIVKFWINAMFYFLFLIAFSYVVLMELHPKVGLVELIVSITVFSLATEEIRQLVMQGDSDILTFQQQVQMWASDRWNLWDLVGIFTFALGFCIRLWEGGLTTGRMLYILDILVWYVRVLDILSVNKLMGPYVNMIGKMMSDTAKFIVILFVFLVSYGVASNALMSPMKIWDWNVLRDIIYIPYWQIYGELFIDEQDNFVTNCSLFPKPDMELCDPGIVLERLIMGMYLLIANVLLINMLIAIFNNTFQRVQENANEIWKFQRYRLIMEFSERPFLPPPFILVVHIYLLLKRLMTSCYRHRKTKPPSDMKIHMDEQSLHLLYRFEEDIVENHLRENTLTEQQSIGGTIEHISERVDAFTLQMEQMCRHDNESKRKLDVLTERMTNLEKAIEGFITHHN